MKIHMEIRPYTEEEWDGGRSGPIHDLIQRLSPVMVEIPWRPPLCVYTGFKNYLGAPCAQEATHILLIEINEETKGKHFLCAKHASEIEQKMLSQYN